MLLRRITRHVEGQNWFAVGVDFVIVVVGLYIGIQVSNWNEERLERRLSDEYMSRLHADLSDDVATLKRRRVFWQSVLDEGAAALAFAE